MMKIEILFLTMLKYQNGGKFDEILYKTFKDKSLLVEN